MTHPTNICMRIALSHVLELVQSRISALHCVICVTAMPKWGLFNDLMLNNVTTGLDLLPLLLTMGTAGTNMNTKQSLARKFPLLSSQRRPGSTKTATLTCCSVRCTSAWPHLIFNRKTKHPFTGNRLGLFFPQIWAVCRLKLACYHSSVKFRSFTLN